jgi:ribosomal subunit interface protein
MALKVSGKNVDIGQALRSRIESTISAVAGKYFDGGCSGHVTVTRAGRAFQTDCALHLDTGAVFEASADAGDAHVSFDIAAERLEKRLRRYKRRLKQHKGRPSAAATLVVPLQPQSEAAWEHNTAEPGGPTIVAEGYMPLPRLSVGAAARHLELAEIPLVCFRNANHGGLNIVYRRSDGHIGWIDPVLIDGRHA